MLKLVVLFLCALHASPTRSLARKLTTPLGAERARLGRAKAEMVFPGGAPARRLSLQLEERRSEFLRNASADDFKEIAERILHDESDEASKQMKFRHLNRILERKLRDNIKASRKRAREYASEQRELAKKSKTSGAKLEQDSGLAEERQLSDDSLTTSSSDVTSLTLGADQATSSRMAMINLQEKSMQNYSQIHSWLDDVQGKVVDLRNDIARSVNDMSVGLQRRSLLMGHYNFLGAGFGAPAGQSMDLMDPYMHF